MDTNGITIQGERRPASLNERMIEFIKAKAEREGLQLGSIISVGNELLEAVPPEINKVSVSPCISTLCNRGVLERVGRGQVKLTDVILGWPTADILQSMKASPAPTAPRRRSKAAEEPPKEEEPEFVEVDVGALISELDLEAKREIFTDLAQYLADQINAGMEREDYLKKEIEMRDREIDRQESLRATETDKLRQEILELRTRNMELQNERDTRFQTFKTVERLVPVETRTIHSQSSTGMEGTRRSRIVVHRKPLMGGVPKGVHKTHQP